MEVIFWTHKISREPGSAKAWPRPRGRVRLPHPKICLKSPCYANVKKTFVIKFKQLLRRRMVLNWSIYHNSIMGFLKFSYGFWFWCATPNFSVASSGRPNERFLAAALPGFQLLYHTEEVSKRSFFCAFWPLVHTETRF